MERIKGIRIKVTMFATDSWDMKISARLFLQS